MQRALRVAARAAALAVLATAGCVSSPTPREPATIVVPRVAGEPSPGGPAGAWLFRAELAGGTRDVSVRLTLRRFAEGGFELVVADALGQTRSRLLADDHGALWLDLEARRACRLEPEAGVPLSGLRSPLPIRELPALLLGTFPVPAVDASVAEDGATTWTDAEGRSFRAWRSAADWSRWTMRLEGEPRVWFRRDGEELELSARRPAFQLRWRRTASGPLPAGARLEASVPPDFVEGPCADADLP